MKPFQERVVEEKKQLDEKIEKLNTFLDHVEISSIPQDEWERLTRQQALMLSYSQVLGERIEHFA